MSKKYKIAVTGGIGGGKSAFCNYLKEKGFPVISADDLAKDILVNNKNVKDQIINSFGAESYNAGLLNKDFLAERVFSSPVNVKKINSIVHPEVISEVNKLMFNELKKNKAVFVEAALIYEAHMEGYFDYIILVTADEEIKKKRLALKGIESEEYERRKSSQISDDKKRTKADFVFQNNGTAEDLKNKAEFLVGILGI